MTAPVPPATAGEPLGTTATAERETRSPATPPKRGSRWQVPLLLVGWILLLLWGWWWIRCFSTPGYFEHGFKTRIPAGDSLGLDFRHNYDAVWLWIMRGENPYRVEYGDLNGPFAYPPVVLLLFAWTVLFTKSAAVIVWAVFIAGVVALAGWFAKRSRETLRLAPLPLPFIWGTALWSMPVLFAMERGQGDAINLLMILVAAAAIPRPPSWRRDLLIGACLALAAWVKINPVVLIPALLALGAWRAFGISVLAAALMGLIPLRATLAWMNTSAVSQRDRVAFLADIIDWIKNPNHTPAQPYRFFADGNVGHSLTTHWPTFWTDTDIAWLKNMPGILASSLFLFSLALLVGLRVFRSPARPRLALAYLLWMAGLGTFWMPVSYDYNLLFLPLAAQAVCDRRDSVVVLASLVGMALWWQPFQLGSTVGSHTFMILKLFSLVGIGLSIVLRTRESPAQAAGS